MNFGRRSTTFTPPATYPGLSELQVGMLKTIARSALNTDIHYARLLKEHVLILPQDVPVGSEGRRIALVIAQSISGLQRLVVTTGPMWMPDLPDELIPRRALASQQLAAYSCVAIAAADMLAQTILGIDERLALEERYDTAWYRRVNKFDSIDDDRLASLLREATERYTGRQR